MKKLFVIFAVIAMVGAFTATAMAADWAFYGSSRFNTFYEAVDEGEAGGDADDAGVDYSMASNSRFGGRVDAGTVQGKFEFGHKSGTKGIYDRILAATFDFGSWQLLMGQDYTLVNNWTSSQRWGGDNGLLGEGALYGARHAQMRFIMGAFRVAIIENSAITDGALPAYDDIDILLPKLEASFNLPVGEGMLGFKGGFQMYTLEDNVADDTEDVMAYVLSADGAHPLGPVYLNWSAFWAQNPGNYGFYINSLVSSEATIALQGADGSFEDAMAYGGSLVVGGAAGEGNNWEVGGSYLQSENDGWGSETESIMALYANFKYSFGKGFYVVPEIGTFIPGDNQAGQDQGSELYAGAHWRMDF